jgi:CheY-like chemotaxis protein/MinD-like ATPase involved in chromosome partitioning or flagellar assembly
MAEKILIVDDDLETLRLMGMMLQRQGYLIIAANNGRQAITSVHTEHPDLIVLDVMMPDMDGYQVAREVRGDPETQNIPILMFTAKSQVDDKVAGYESGADDYLTKPVHPAELAARVKVLLSRVKLRGVTPSVPQSSSVKSRGHMIAVIAPKGGLGVSTLVLNLGISIYTKTREEVIAAELRPGHGTWGLDLGFNDFEGLNRLLRRHSTEINPSLVEKELIRTTYGARLLMTTSRLKDVELITASDQMLAVVKALPLLANVILLDIGAAITPGISNVLSACQEAILVTEPFPGTINQARILVDELNALEFGRSKLMSLVVFNRVRADIQVPMAQIQEKLGLTAAQVIPPAPEQAYQAALQFQPLAQIQTDGLVSQQFSRLADYIIQRIKK